MPIYRYDSVSAAVYGLKSKIFRLIFNLEKHCLICQGIKFDVNDFKIIEHHRFEGNSDPADEVVVYAVEGNVYQKGCLTQVMEFQRKESEQK